MKFNETQIQAIRHFRGPALVLAGPGSGKTAVITHRTRQLITKYGIDPGSILVITFTRAAAGEMEQRFYALMNEEGTDSPVRRLPVTFGTFHSVFFLVLKLAYHMSGDNIIREEQRYALMRELIAAHNIDYRDEKEMIRGILAEIGQIKNSQIDIETFASVQCDPGGFRSIFRAYEHRLKGSRLIDFDDMLTYTWELFDQRKDILSAWQKKYQFILIDEFQDINPIQYEIIRMLAAPENNLFIVGDDDQSIYGFRGSEPGIMLGFTEDYPDTAKILLDTNYRCDAHVVEDSLRLIGHNRVRFEKKIKAGRPGINPVEYPEFKDRRQEYDYVVKQIREARENGLGWEDFAVLFRTNTQPGPLMELMVDCHIPFRVRDHVPNLYEHWIARDIFAYIRIARGSRSRADFLQIMNRPLRYISRNSLPEDTVDFAAWKAFYRSQDWIADRIDRMEYDAQIMGEMSPYAAVNYIRHAIEYDTYLEEYAKRRGGTPGELFEVADELQATAKGFKSYPEWFAHIHEYSDNLKKIAAQRMSGADAVTLTTLHSSKGLEFPWVFIIDANEGIMPYKKAVLPEAIEEERRMFYVGMTRAKEKLLICHARDMGEGEISRFAVEAKESRGISWTRG